MLYCIRLTTNSSLLADLELLLTHCAGVWACALLSSALILSSVTSSMFSAPMTTCASWNTEGKIVERDGKLSDNNYVNLLHQCMLCCIHKQPHMKVRNPYSSTHSPFGGFSGSDLQLCKRWAKQLCNCFGYKDCERTKIQVLASVWGQECIGLDSYR